MKEVKLPVLLKGVTSRYKGNGRKLGYPTANIGAQTDLPDGVYFGFTTMGNYRHYPSIIFIGTPTTVGDTERRTEAHVLDIADHDYYGLAIELAIEKYHRPNQTFDSVAQLEKAMKDDEEAARDWFAKNNKKQDN